MNDKVAVFGQRRAGVYLLSEIYNPDNVTTSVQNVGKVIPAVGSLVVDDSVTEHNTLYVVYSVDAATFKTTLVPAAVAASTDLGDDQIITYGNNVYMLFYQNTVIQMPDTSGSSTNKTFWELVVDNKICICGTSAKYYSIIKGSSIDSTAEVVTDRYYEGSVLTEATDGRVPMDLVTIPCMDSTGVYTDTQAMIPRTAYSETIISDGETYTFVVYDKDNRVIAQIVLVSHQMLGLGTLTAKRSPIESFTVTANQWSEADKKCFLYRGQSLDELQFYPNIIYANGEQNISTQIDNTQLFIYGKEEISTSVVGNVYEVLFKYYLGYNESCQTGKDYSIGETGRYIYVTAKVMIISPYTSSIGKLALMTKVDLDKKYQVLPVIYYKNRSTAPAIVANEDYIANNFDNDLYNTPQLLKLKTYEQITGDVVSSPYYQSYQITLFNPDVVKDNVLYYFRDEPSQTGNYYGKDTLTIPRPVIYHTAAVYEYIVATGKFLANVVYYTRTGSGTTEDPYVYTEATVVIGADIPENTYYTKTIKTAEKNYIPKTVFQSTQMFLNSFYYKADPPLGDNELTIPTPTHFQIRKLDIGVTPASSHIDVVVPSPIKIEDYGNDLALTETLFHTTGYPNTCIVEFLYSDDSATYQYLYGVPVEVILDDPEAIETGDTYRGPLFFTYMQPTTAEVNLYKMFYKGTDTNRGFNRWWQYNGPNDSIIVKLEYNRTSGEWTLSRTVGSTVKSWKVACTDDTADVCSLIWNYTGSWIYDNEVTITKYQTNTDLLQYVAFDTKRTVEGLITAHPTITAPAKYVVTAEEGAYLLLNYDGTPSAKTTGYVSSTVHSSWFSWNRDYTIEMWINAQYDNLIETIFSSNKDYQFAVGHNIGETSKKHHLMLSNWEQVNDDKNWLNPPSGYTGSSTDITANTWTHIAVTHNAANKLYTLFINGTAVATANPTTESSNRPYWYENFIQIGKWATNEIPSENGRIAQNMAIHGFRVCRSARYIAPFNPKWNTNLDPEFRDTADIELLQINESSRQDPHYSIALGTWTNSFTKKAEIYIDGSADDCFEVVKVDGTTETSLWTDRDPSETGSCHTYSNVKVCTIDPGITIKFLLWDTCRNLVRWSGKAIYKLID